MYEINWDLQQSVDISDSINTHHSWNCCEAPNEFPYTKPPIGFPLPCNTIKRRRSTKRETYISAMVIHLSAVIARWDVDFREIANTGDLNIVWSLDPVYA